MPPDEANLSLLLAVTSDHWLQQHSGQQPFAFISRVAELQTYLDVRDELAKLPPLGDFIGMSMAEARHPVE
jgi:hypothetical protein